jgi:diguanylate cyclase (GGDEF)-like protein
MKGFRGAGITINARNIEEVAAFASVPSSGWFVVARLPTSEAFAPITRLRHFIITSTVIMLSVFLVVMIFVMRYLLRPLMSAAQHADRMTLGEIPLEPLPVVRNDEVGHLTIAFNRVLSKLLVSRSELEHIANHDALTGLPNRQLLADRMKQAMARAQRNKEQLALLFLDLDGFKPVNDSLGHEAGDVVLHEVAERLSAVMRGEDTLARVGGDEFVILLSDLSGNARDAAELVANKCLAVFQQPFVIYGQSCQLGVSIGIVIGNGDCSSDKLLIAADQAMYQAKESGRGQFCWADECLLCSKGDAKSPCSIRKQ